MEPVIEFIPERKPEPQLTRDEWEQNCYGCSQSALDETVSRHRISSGISMIVMSILSDSQQYIEFGEEADLELARQLINRAKYIQSQYMVDNEGGKNRL